MVTNIEERMAIREAAAKRIKVKLEEISEIARELREDLGGNSTAATICDITLDLDDAYMSVEILADYAKLQKGDFDGREILVFKKFKDEPVEVYPNGYSGRYLSPPVKYIDE